MRPLLLPVTIPAAGVSFCQDVLSRLSAGDRLSVVHEPENPADPNACRILTAAGEPVGYVPGLLAPRLLASGPSPYRAEVAELLGSPGRMGLRLRLLPAAEGLRSGEDSALAHGHERNDQVQVRARSGRILGTLEFCKGGMVGVRTVSGAVVEYPEALVLLAPTG